MSEVLFSVQSLTKHFGGLCATDNLSLDIFQGELHALIGPNGAGKTTAISQFSGELKPDAGFFKYRGKDIGHLNVEQRARLGIVRSYQITSIFHHLTVVQNVMLAVQAKSGSHYHFFADINRDRQLYQPAMQFLAMTGLDHRASLRAEYLSHGEKRQLEIAMVLATDPELLLLDEPMAGMGLEESARMIEFIRSLKRRYTILLVEHDVNAVFELADRISVLVYGRIIATGSAAEIQSHPEVRAAYLGDKH